MGNDILDRSVKEQYNGQSNPNWENQRAMFDSVTHKMVFKVVGEMDSGNQLQSMPVMRYFNPRKGYKWRSHGRHVVRMSTDIPIPDNMTFSDVGKLYILGRKIHYFTGMLMLQDKRKQERYLMVKDIAEILGIRTTQTRNFLKKLKKNDMIRQTDAGWYSLNPLYFSPTYINKDLYFLWEDVLKNFIPNTIKLVFAGLADEETGYIKEYVKPEKETEERGDISG